MAMIGVLPNRPMDCAAIAIRVGVGTIVLDKANRILLLQRGPLARNEQGMWADPGGAVEHGETLSEAIAREVWEEVGIRIAQLTQLAVFDHRLPDGEQWMSVAFVARHLSGIPTVREPGKCSAWGWFDLNALPAPLSPLLQAHLVAYQQRCLQAREPPFASSLHTDLHQVGQTFVENCFLEQRFF